MIHRAKLFRNGGSQAVRLPKAFRFPEGQQEVSVRRVGKKLIIEPLDEYPESFLKSLGSIDEDIPRIPQAPLSDLLDRWK